MNNDKQKKLLLIVHYSLLIKKVVPLQKNLLKINNQ